MTIAWSWWAKSKATLFPGCNGWLNFRVRGRSRSLSLPWIRLLHAGKAIVFYFSHCHALITLYAQFLCSDWSKFGRWVHAENLCSVWKLVYFDSWSWQSFVSTCDVFNCLLPLAVQNEIQLLSRLFCNSWLVCLLRFLLTNAPLVKVIGNPISDGIVFKNEPTHLPLLEA